MEDPLFDPWSNDVADPASAEEPEGSEERRPAAEEPNSRRSGVRWRSTGGGVPAKRSPLPSKLSELGAESAGSSESQPSAEPTEPNAESGPAEGTPEHTLLRRMDWLVRRLRAAGHGATVDDQLDQPRRSVRIDFAPHTSPFSTDDREGGSVLDVRLDPDTEELVARSWVEPDEQHPRLEGRAPVDEVDDAFVHGLLLDFVKRTLRSA